MNMRARCFSVFLRADVDYCGVLHRRAPHVSSMRMESEEEEEEECAVEALHVVHHGREAHCILLFPQPEVRNSHPCLSCTQMQITGPGRRLF